MQRWRETVDRDDSSQNTYYMRTDTGTLVAQKLPAGTVHYYLYDGLGSVVNIVDTNGTAQATYTYDAWGNTALSGSAAAGNPFRYVGGTAEPGGLIKFGTRYYDPTFGRWTQQDPVAGDSFEPSSLNRSCYAGGDPINWTDIDGRRRSFWSTLRCAAKKLTPSPIPSGSGAVVEAGAMVGSSGVAAMTGGIALGGGALAIGAALPLVVIGAGVMAYGGTRIYRECRK